VKLRGQLAAQGVDVSREADAIFDLHLAHLSPQESVARAAELRAAGEDPRTVSDGMTPFTVNGLSHHLPAGLSP
jgi:hypothetical protein